MEEPKQKDPFIVSDMELDNDGECTMCKFVFAFALIGVFLVIIFTYFFKLHTTPSVEPLPQAEVRPVSDAEWQTRILELKRTANGERPATSTKL